MQDDDYNSVRCEYVEMLENQIAKSNNGIVRTKLLTFGVNVDDLPTARARLERDVYKRQLQSRSPSRGKGRRGWANSCFSLNQNRNGGSTNETTFSVPDRRMERRAGC